MIDLKDLMDERSSGTPGFDHLRLASVRRRVTVRRRRRIITTALTAVAVLLFGGYALSPDLTAKKSAPISATPSPVADNPDYSSGQHRVVWREVPLSAGQLELVWTPESWQLNINISCTDAPKAMISVRLNDGVLDDRTICASSYVNVQSSLEPMGVRPGQPAKLTVTVLDGATSAGVLKAAVWVNVPFAEYPLPARPAKLKPLSPLGPCPGKTDVTVLRSDPADPLKPMSVNVAAAPYLNLVYQSTTPGQLRYGIYGQQQETITIWDYQAGIGLHAVKPSDAAAPTTFTVTPETATGPWQVAIIPAEQKYFCIVDEDGPGYINLG